jgi:hypothetical protein
MVVCLLAQPTAPSRTNVVACGMAASWGMLQGARMNHALRWTRAGKRFSVARGGEEVETRAASVS